MNKTKLHIEFDDYPVYASKLGKRVGKEVSKYHQIAGKDQHHLHALIMDEVEAALIQTVLIANDYNRTQTANQLGLTRTTLRSKIKRYQLENSK